MRFKLTLLFVLVFGVIITVLSIVVHVFWEKNVLDEVDLRLLDRADSAVEQIERVANEGRDSPFDEDVLPQLKGLRQSRYYFQLRAADGTSIVRSPNLRNVRLPLPEDTDRLRRTMRSYLETLTGGEIAPILGADGQMRLLTRYCEVPGVLPFFLQVGLNMGTFNTSRAALRRMFTMVIPIGLLAGGIASWLLVRRSLAPVRKIAREAQVLTAARLDRRIPPPEAMDEVGEMVVTINQMLDRLENAFLAQERFIADAAHELKTPITIVKGIVQVLEKKGRTADEYDQSLSGVVDEMRRLGQLVDSLLMLARADAGMPLKSASAVSINEVATDVVQRWQPLAAERGIRLVLSLSMPRGDEPEPLVNGDAELLDAMVSNLVQNGVRYSPDGEVVEVGVRICEPVVRIIVRDYGRGIPAKDMEHVFERFYRVPRVKDGSTGTGLGLAIAKGVARLHKGTIEVANRANGGCEFVVELPLTDGQL